MNTSCYLCNYPHAPKPLILKPTFTAHLLAQNKASTMMCERCYDLMEGRYQFGYYREKAVFTRCTSWLLVDPRDLTNPLNKPYFGDTVNVKGNPVHTLNNLPTRDDMIDFLLNPPEVNHFEVAIAKSGKKHILYLAKPCLSRDSFTVVFEESYVQINHVFRTLFSQVQRLINLKISKTEILTGQYSMHNYFHHMAIVEEVEAEVKAFRLTRQFELVLHIIQFQNESI